MEWLVDQSVAATTLHILPGVQNRHLVAERAYGGEVMADQEIRQPKNFPARCK